MKQVTIGARVVAAVLLCTCVHAPPPVLVVTPPPEVSHDGPGPCLPASGLPRHVFVSPHLDLRPGVDTPVTLRLSCTPFAATVVEVMRSAGLPDWVVLPNTVTFPARTFEQQLVLKVGARTDAPLQPIELGQVSFVIDRNASESRVFYAQAMAGFADTHNHQFANHGFGGNVVYGTPAGDVGSLGLCTPHVVNASLVGLFTEAPHSGTSVHGAPGFEDWPAAHSWLHQGVHRAYLEKAWREGLRLMVMLAVTNKFVCDVVEMSEECNDMRAARKQVCSAWALQRRIDSECGAEGCGWFRVVTTPEAARAQLHAGKLAVVLGVEVDNLLDCNRGGVDLCDDDTMRTRLDALVKLGVRHVFPVHFWANAFGTAALSNPLTGPSDEVSRCDPALDYQYVHPRLLPGNGLELPWSTPFTSYELAGCEGFTDDELLSPPVPYAPPGRAGVAVGAPSAAARTDAERVICAPSGLTPQGKTLVTELMRRGLMIDVDHMSDKSFADTLELTEGAGYPVVSGHGGLLDVSNGDRRTEANSSIRELRRLRDSGSFISLITNQGTQSGQTVFHDHPGPVCPDSAEGFVAALRYLQAVQGQLPSGVGTDFNGGVNQPGGRGARTTDECNSFHLGYPRPALFAGAEGIAPQTFAGSRAYDFNVDGLAHIGLLPDFVSEVTARVSAPYSAAPLLRGADGYISAWEHAARLARERAVP